MKNIMLGLFCVSFFSGYSAFADSDSARVYLKKKNLTKVEKQQAELLKCSKTVIQKQYGGLEAPVLVHDILLKGMVNGSLTNDIAELKNLTSECQELKKTYAPVGKKEVERREMAETIWSLEEKSDASKKISKLLLSIYDVHPLFCKGKIAMGEASLFLGGGVGIASYKCLLTDGTLKNYIGASLQVNLASLALVGGVKNFESYLIGVNEFGFAFAEKGKKILDRDDDEMLGLGVMKIEYANGEKTVLVGGMFSGLKWQGGAGFRAFNGKTRWKLLLDQLK